MNKLAKSHQHEAVGIMTSCQQAKLFVLVDVVDGKQYHHHSYWNGMENERESRILKVDYEKKKNEISLNLWIEDMWKERCWDWEKEDLENLQMI